MFVIRITPTPQPVRSVATTAIAANHTNETSRTNQRDSTTKRAKPRQLSVIYFQDIILERIRPAATGSITFAQLYDDYADRAASKQIAAANHAFFAQVIETALSEGRSKLIATAQPVARTRIKQYATVSLPS